LFSIARNLALNELARAAGTKESAAQGAAASSGCMQPEPLDQVAEEQSSVRLHQALGRLSLEDRTTLALVYVRELPLADIAALEGTTVGAVKTRVHRAKAKLREWLGTGDE
jgi:RNA polymerase sigma-70 factor, ECF subfamily